MCSVLVISRVNVFYIRILFLLIVRLTNTLFIDVNTATSKLYLFTFNDKVLREKYTPEIVT